MSLVSLLRGTGPSGFGYGSTAADVVKGLDLSGKTYLITGCNSGIGKESMRAIASAGAHVVAAARTVEKAERAAKDVGADATPVACELSDPESVRKCAETIATGPRLDGMLCNAGIMALPELTVEHGLELQFLTNHIGHFILVTRLLDHLTDDGRVVMVSSEAHRRAPADGIMFDNLDGSKSYSPWGFYGQSKVANLLFAKALAKRLPNGQTANALHPGVIHTNLARNMNPVVDVVLKIGSPLVLKSIEEGAATQTWATVHPDAAKFNGEYFSDCNPKRPSQRGSDADLAERLWTTSEEIVARLLD